MKKNVLDRLSLDPAVASFLLGIADSSSRTDAPTYEYAAKVILSATDWPAEDFLPLLIKNLEKTQNLKPLFLAKSKQQQGDFSPFSFSLYTTSGKRVFFLALPRPDASQPGGEGVCISIAAQIPRRRNEGKLPSLMGAGDPILRLLDVLPAYVLLISKDHSVLFSNRLARQLFGNIKGKKCHLLLKDLETPCENCPPSGVFSSSHAKINDWVHAKSNSAFRAHSYPFETADGSRYILQIGINITAGVRAQNALDLSEQRYRSIAENLTMGLVLIEPSFNTITLNPKMEEWFGPGLAKGVRLDRLFAGYDEEAGREVSRLLTEAVTGKKNREGEFLLSPQNGEQRHFRLIACPILVRSEIVRAVVVMIEDITDSRNMALRIQQMQRLEALGSLAGGIAHEINQPLSALHLYASGLLMMFESGTPPPQERLMERLSLILSQADKIRLVVNHMRALVMQEGNPSVTAVSVAEAVDGALSLVGMQLHDHNIRVHTQIPGDLPAVSANTMQLEQVVINLLVNAMHALDTVAIPDKRIRIMAEAAQDNTVIFRIRDNGPGVGPLQSRIFDPFFSTKEPQKGMGLGLSIVHAFISGWGGEIRAADNTDGPGATFSVKIPVAK